MASRDREFTEYVAARLPWLRRVAFLLCQDSHHGDDLVQATITSLYVHWGRASRLDHVDAYVRTMLVRQYLSERRSGWARRITLPGDLPQLPVPAADHDAALDLRGAVSALPAGQRATLVLRFYCDLTVEETAQELGCSTGTVKSQTAKALAALRRTLRPAIAEPTAGEGREHG
jgi:RNA polymerase sigma-70 factor (sigma-E family)